jgi:hypothetical protein
MCHYAVIYRNIPENVTSSLVLCVCILHIETSLKRKSPDSLAVGLWPKMPPSVEKNCLASLLIFCPL